MQDFTIILGYKCNYLCDHCANYSSLINSNCLSASEIFLINETLQRYQPKTLTFVGGEPTLYICEINQILSKLSNYEKTQVQIITNGWFAKNEISIESTLSRITKLDTLFMSFDIFHGSSTKKEYVKTAIEYCKKNNIQFELMMCISSPEDLIIANNLLSDLSVKVNFQKVVKCGRAITNRNFFKYPTFEEKVLQKKCPSSGKLAFLPGKGFSTCCSTLVFETHFDDVSNFDLDCYLKSEFYENITTMSFAEIADKYSVSKNDFDTNDSLECNLCAEIFRRIMKKRVVEN